MKTPTIFLPVIATLILSPLAQAENKLYFPHVAVGEGLTSNIVVLNPSAEDNVTNVKFDWFEQDGETFPPRIRSLRPIGPLGWNAKMFSNLGGFSINRPAPLPNRSELRIGSVVVTSQGALTGFIRFRVDGVGMTVASPSIPASRVIFPVQIGEIRTGVAIRNVEEETISVTLSLIGRRETVEMSDPISIPGNGQISRFLDEYLSLPDLSSLPRPPFPYPEEWFSQRFVVVEALEGEIAVMALEQGSRVGEFIALPVSKVKPPEE